MKANNHHKFMLALSMSAPLLLTGCLSAGNNWVAKAEATGSVSAIQVETTYQKATTSGVIYDHDKEKIMAENITNGLKQYFTQKGYAFSTVENVNKEALAKSLDWIVLGAIAKDDMLPYWNGAYGGNTFSFIAQFTKDRPNMNAYITNSSAQLAPNARYGIYVKAHQLEYSGGLWAQTIGRTLGAVATLGLSEVAIGASGANDVNKEAKPSDLTVSVVDHQTGQLLYTPIYRMVPSDALNAKKTAKELARILDQVFEK